MFESFPRWRGLDSLTWTVEDLSWESNLAGGCLFRASALLGKDHLDMDIVNEAQGSKKSNLIMRSMCIDEYMEMASNGITETKIGAQ